MIIVMVMGFTLLTELHFSSETCFFLLLTAKLQFTFITDPA